MSPGHHLFRLLQDGKYYAATRDGVAYDYWDELPHDRRLQYERAAEALIEQGAEAERMLPAREFDSEAPTMAPPPEEFKTPSEFVPMPPYKPRYKLT